MNLLRRALSSDGMVEDPQEEQPAIELKGPLGEVYTKALNIAFAKPDEATGRPVLESQANDALMQSNLVKIATQLDTFDQSNPNTTIYGVSKSEVAQDDVVEVAKQLASTETKPEDFILVVDATKMASNPEDLNSLDEYVVDTIVDPQIEGTEFAPVLESMVIAYGGKVVYSLEEAFGALVK